jgi:hypothetical protein
MPKTRFADLCRNLHATRMRHRVRHLSQPDRVCSRGRRAAREILREVAYRVPVNLSTPQRVEAMIKQINDEYFDGFSLIAVSNNDEVVGFQLARKRLWFKQPYVDLAYAGVTARAEDAGIFRRFIEIEKQHRLPLVAEVKLDNKSNMGATLMRYGFQPQDIDRTNFRWNPQ